MMDKNNQINNQMQPTRNTGNGNPNNWNYDPVTGQPLNNQNNYQNQYGAPVPEHVYKEMLKQQQKIHDNNSTECRILCIASLVCWLVSNFFFFFEHELPSCHHALEISRAALE